MHVVVCADRWSLRSASRRCSGRVRESKRKFGSSLVGSPTTYYYYQKSPWCQTDLFGTCRLRSIINVQSDADSAAAGASGDGLVRALEQRQAECGGSDSEGTDSESDSTESDSTESDSTESDCCDSDCT